MAVALLGAEGTGNRCAPEVLVSVETSSPRPLLISQAGQLYVTAEGSLISLTFAMAGLLHFY